jgi:YHS domain-containing protein
MPHCKQWPVAATNPQSVWRHPIAASPSLGGSAAPPLQGFVMLLRLFSVFLTLFMLSFGPVHAAEPVATGFLGNIAIGGQDTVSYFSPQVRQTHRVLAGEKGHEVQYRGATWRFASRQSAERFAADPARYVPHYNGHCANALSLGEGLIATDGKVWEFFGDQLYLFYAERGRQRWLAGDWKVYRDQADAAWQAVIRK